MDSIQLKLCDIQGRLFERSKEYESEGFIRNFMNSEVADHLDSPYNKLQWMGEEYLLDELNDEKQLIREGEKYSADILYWIGYIYRYWACSRGEKSRRIYRYAPAKTMKRNYMAFHTLDPEIAIDDLIEIKRQRKQSGREAFDHSV
ncbi:MAG: hypothetical protein IJ719_00755 [Clostridia bacterium]|nr:hypothetical protein [Clostridia bacterium]